MPLVLQSSTVLAVAIIVVLAARICAMYRVSDNALPQPEQGPLYKRLFREPHYTELIAWAMSIPNEGLIKYRGALNKERILVTSPAAVHEVHERRAYSYGKDTAARKMMASLLGNGLVTAIGQQHQAQRRLLQPAFKLSSVRGQYPVIWSSTRDLVSKLGKLSSLPGQKSVEIVELVNRATLDIIGQAGLGTDFDCLSDDSSEMWHDYAAAFQSKRNGSSPEASWQLLARVLPRRVMSMLPSKRNREIGKAVHVVRKKVEQIIASKKRAAGGVVVHDNSSLPRSDMISMMLRDDATSMASLVDQFLGILGAGHETIAQSVCLAVYELSRRPALQCHQRAEILENLYFTDRHSTIRAPSIGELAQVEQLPLLNAVCSETLRRYPVIPHLRRETTQGVTLCGVHLAKGQSAVTVLEALNSKPELWDRDPSQFMVERWLESPNGGARARQAFMTFGHGPRSCIGEKFARAEMALLLAGIIAAFEVEFVGTGEHARKSEVELDLAIVLMIQGGLWVKLTPLAANFSL